MKCTYFRNHLSRINPVILDFQLHTSMSPNGFIKGMVSLSCAHTFIMFQAFPSRKDFYASIASRFKTIFSLVYVISSKVSSVCILSYM